MAGQVACTGRIHPRPLPIPERFHMPALPSLIRIGALMLFAAAANASEESQLVEALNAYRSQPQRCANQVSAELPPLANEPPLVLPVNTRGDLREAMARPAYTMASV